MKCQICGGTMRPSIVSLPFRRESNAIVVIKALPVIECGGCGEFLLEDDVMAYVDAILEKAPEGTELEVAHYAA